MKQYGETLAALSVNTEKPKMTVDAGAIYPLGAVWAQGCSLSSSLDGVRFRKVNEKNAGQRSARWLRAELSAGHSEGSAHIQVGDGFVAEPAAEWTDAFARREPGEAWRGADGIYSTVTHIAPLDSQRKSLFTFGDTFLSGIGRKGQRTKPITMVNNSHAVLTGLDPLAPGALSFRVPRDQQGRPGSLLTPDAGAFGYAAAGVKHSDVYYWMQDIAVLDGHLYTWPMLITHDPTGREGMQFRVLGTTMARFVLKDGAPVPDSAEQFAVNLFYKDAHLEVLYGCAALRTPEGNIQDGWLYLYGYRTDNTGRYLCAGRVRPENMQKRDAWRFFDGTAFVPDIRASAPLCKDVSAELSVSLLTDGPQKGKYLLVYQHQTNHPWVGVALGDSPVGPFSKGRLVWHCAQADEGRGIYTYNAKAHPAFSPPGRVLVSFNVNSYGWQNHIDDALLYRPRFLWLHHTRQDPWARLFAQAAQSRLSQFRWLNAKTVPGGTVFAGDSLVQECPIGELAQGQPFYNRGIGGDTAWGLLHHLNDSVLALKPRQAVILCGTNDLAEGTKPREVARHLIAIARRIRTERPACRVYLLSIPPVYDAPHQQMDALAVGTRTNRGIRAVNAILKKEAAPSSYAYVDIHTALRNRHGRIQPRYTQEGLHLSAEGYQRVMEVLQSALQ